MQKDNLQIDANFNLSNTNTRENDSGDDDDRDSNDSSSLTKKFQHASSKFVKIMANNNSNSSNATNSTNENSFMPSNFSSPQSSDKKKQHCCPFCDRSFTRPYRLNDHISFSHTDEVRFWFSVC